MVTKDYERVRKIFKCAIYDVIPHEVFTFGKIWILYAEFEIRQMNLQRAKLILGEAIGKTQKKNVIKRYIEILVNLKEADNARNLYQKWLELYPDDTEGWIDYATFEKKLVEHVRVRGILDLAITQEVLDMPEKVWKFYIDFEIEAEENDRARALYERLLERTKNVRVWTSYAQFECSVESFGKAREIFKRGEKYFKVDAVHDSATEERVMLLEDWRDFEDLFGTDETKKEIAQKLPKKVKRKRPVYNQEGVEVGQEEYYDYIFPEEDAISGNLNLLQMAMKWKMAQVEKAEDPLSLN
jgi:crooked neck